MRGKSVSLSTTSSPWKDAPNPAPMRPKTLAKATSLADLRDGLKKPKWLQLRKRASKAAVDDDDDFGCAGEEAELAEEEEEDVELVIADVVTETPKTAPPRYTPIFAASQEESTADAADNLSSEAEDLTIALDDTVAAARRKAAEQAAVDALTFFFASVPSSPVVSSTEDPTRSRSSSTTSFSSSSRPRTNDSLPSYHSGSSSSITPTNRRPQLTGQAAAALTVDAKVAPAGPRTYAFI